MKKILLLLAAILTCSFSAHAKLNVVATLPDFGSLARAIGGDKIDVNVLAKATEDPHFVDARPSFVVSLRNADVLIDGGAELELGWLPPLLQNARNPKIEVGKPGRVQASQGIRLMGVPTTRTTRNLKRRSIRSSSSGAQPCCRSKASRSPPITNRGFTSRTVSDSTSTSSSNRSRAFRHRRPISSRSSKK